MLNNGLNLMNSFLAKFTCIPTTNFSAPVSDILQRFKLARRGSTPRKFVDL